MLEHHQEFLEFVLGTQQIRIYNQRPFSRAFFAQVVKPDATLMVVDLDQQTFLNELKPLRRRFSRRGQFGRVRLGLRCSRCGGRGIFFSFSWSHFHDSAPVPAI